MSDDTRGLGLMPATAADYRELARRRLPRQAHIRGGNPNPPRRPLGAEPARHKQPPAV